MKKNLVNTFISIVGRAALTTTLVMMAMTTPAVAQVDDNQESESNNEEGDRAKVFSPKSHPYGNTYAQWSAKWWQWAVSLPVDQNPFFDVTGCQNGANGQSGPVWFLTGVIAESGTAQRTCTVPGGKALFFPLINTECSTVEPPPFFGGNYAELRACASNFRVSNLIAEIDGVPVKHLEKYLVESPMFSFTLPENNVFGVPAGEGQSVSRGYYLMLAPLAPGSHLIHFGGTYDDFAFTLDITYHLTVE